MLHIKDRGLAIIKKSLIILIILIPLNQLLTSFYLALAYPNLESDISGWLTFGLNILIDSLSIYLINRNNLIGDGIAFYQVFVWLQLDYAIGGYYGMKIFLSSPQSMFNDILEILIVILIVVHGVLIVAKKIKPHQIVSVPDQSTQQSFSTRHKLDLCLIGFFAILIIFYWGLWAVLRYGG